MSQSTTKFYFAQVNSTWEFLMDRQLLPLMVKRDPGDFVYGSPSLHVASKIPFCFQFGQEGERAWSPSHGEVYISHIPFIFYQLN